MRLGDTVRLQIPNRLEFLGPTRSFLETLAEVVGFGERERGEIALAYEEAYVNVVSHAFDEQERASFAVSFEVVPRGLRIVVHDEGLPFDLSAVPEHDPSALGDPGRDLSQVREGGLGLFLMRRLMDEFEFRNLGPGGKEIRMTKRIAGDHVAELLPEEDWGEGEAGERMPRPEGAGSPAPEPSPFSVRLFEPGDALEVARCAYRAYGYSYPNIHVFFPERFAGMVASGEIVSVVAVASDGDLMGHAALEVPRPGARVAEAGMAFVKPRYRGRGCLERMTAFLEAEARARGFVGLYARSVTRHAASQKAAIRGGYRDCALLAGAFPASMDFKGLGGEGGQRLSLLCSYRSLTPFPGGVLHVPARHEGMIRRILENLEISSESVPEEPAGEKAGAADLSERGLQRVSVVDAVAEAWVMVERCGKDTVPAILREARGLKRRGISWVGAGIPLASPSAPEICRALEAAGFFFAGLLPDPDVGVRLVLQDLGETVSLDYGRIEVWSDLAKELRDYVRSTGPETD